MLQSTVCSLLYFLKEWCIDLDDVDAAGFRSRIDALSEAFRSDQSAKGLDRAFAREREFIIEFIDQQKRCVREREAELTSIIELLRSSLAGMIGESQEFNGQMYERNVRMEQISTLNDLRLVRQGLSEEISRMKKAIREKQENDRKRAEKLSEQVDVLRGDLEKAVETSMTDALTGAHNRLAFDDQMSNWVDRYHAVGKPLSLLMCDIDDFKKINDTYGHQVGDLVLATFVRECRKLVRQEDFLARYGGEEFSIILPNTALKVAIKRARKICETFSSNRYVVEGDSIYRTVKFTVSMGVSELRRNDNVQQFIRRADEALYLAKRTGKNRVASEQDVEAENRRRAA